MDSINHINLDELERYVTDRRNEEKRAEKAAIRAEHLRILEEKEAERTAEAKREAKERVLSDPSNQAAELVHAALGADWPKFVALVNRGSVQDFIKASNRIGNATSSAVNHAAAVAAPRVREAAKDRVVTVRRSAIEAELVAAGFMRDVTPETESE